MLRMDRSMVSHGKNSNEGTSARTRPFSFEEIMLRREKKLIANSLGSTRELAELSNKIDTNGASDQSDSDGGYRSTKFSREMQKENSKKMEYLNLKREGYHLAGKDRGNHDLEAKVKLKSDHSMSSRDRESKTEKLSHHKSRTSDRLRADPEKRHEKKRSKDTVKDRHEEKDRNAREGKRKHPSHGDEKIRPEIDVSYSKKQSFERLWDTEYSERNHRRKERPQPYKEEVRSKRRRSRSLEYDRERDWRSISVSPRAQERSHLWDYGDSLIKSYKDKSRSKYPNAEKYTSGNDGHNRKHRSGLGGYSPRKRKTEAAVKTPSPTVRSPERKSATWDQPPAGTGPMTADFQSPANKMQELVSSISATLKPTVTTPEPTPSIDIAPMVLNASVDSVQLTQATRPMRRLYVENLPASISDKTVIDCLNDFLLPLSANHIQRNNPCISCIINKEKCQALVEFLTPEDATRAFSFDGRSISGSLVKIRRPKDFIEATSGALEKAVSAVKPICDVVNDSPNKIFVGGLSKALSSDMFMEIASAFGIVRAYHFDFNEDLNEPFAFLEYEDHSITLKACSGMNGLKLGGRVLTAVQALPDVHRDEESSDAAPSYDIPMHAKPLLADPTQVLQLKNVFDREQFLLIAEPELEETMEDIRLECARFGTIKTLNVVRHSEDPTVDNSCEMEEIPSNDSKQNGIQNPSEVAVDKNGNDEDVAKSEIDEGTKAKSPLVSESPKSAEAGDGFNGDGAPPPDVQVLEVGCVMVEFVRKESASMAAHSLHGRAYGDRTVAAGYVPHHLYLAQFPR